MCNIRPPILPAMFDHTIAYINVTMGDIMCKLSLNGEKINQAGSVCNHVNTEVIVQLHDILSQPDNYVSTHKNKFYLPVKLYNPSIFQFSEGEGHVVG